MRSPDGRPALASATADGEVILRELDLQRQPGDELLTLNNDAAIGTIDLLDFGPYARPLSIVISAKETDTPLVIGIDGQWGQGKTRLGHMVDAELPTERRQMTGEARRVDSIWFNAWMHSDAEDLATAIAASVAVGVQPLRPWWRRLLSPTPGRAIGGLRRYGRIIAMAVAVLAGAALLIRPEWLGAAYDATGHRGRPGAVLARRPVGDARAAAARGARPRPGGRRDEDAFRVPRRHRRPERQGGRGAATTSATASPTRRAPFPIHRSRPRSPCSTGSGPGRCGPGRACSATSCGDRAAVLGVRHARRVVLFVDDLDRCNSARSVEACEALSQLLDHPGLVTVVMVDLEALATHAEVQFTALAERIHPDRKGAGWGRRFLDKVFQFEFTIPAHRSAALSVLLRSSLDARAPVPLKPDPVEGGRAGGGFRRVRRARPAPTSHRSAVEPYRELPRAGSHHDATSLRCDRGVAAVGPRPRRTPSAWTGCSSLSRSSPCTPSYAVEPWWGKVLVGLMGVAVTVAVLWRQTRARIATVPRWTPRSAACSGATRSRPPARSGASPPR